MVSNKKSLSEEQIFADIMEMISSSNKKSKNVKSSSDNKKKTKNVKSSSDNKKKTKNVKNSSSKSKKNLRGGFAPIGVEDMDDSNLAPVEAFMENSPNHPGRNMGINVSSQGVSDDMGTSGGIMPHMRSPTMSGGKKKRRVVKKSGVKKAVKKSGVKKAVKKVATKKRVVKKVGAKKVKKVDTKKRVAKKSGAKKVKKVAKKSKRVAKK